MSVLLHELARIRAACDEARARGSRVGFVPTMGALHAGHMSLCRAAREHGADLVVVSVFVNPLQFGPAEDFGRYPRTLEADVALCREHGVDLVYAPDVQAVYPTGFQSHVDVEALTQGFEGAARPTHFRGVTTVVAKLFNSIGPCVALFGRKDYQQWRVIERMASDLAMPVEVVGCPILREPDGLAMSSRNRYLTPEQRSRATAIFRGLRAADAAFRAGEREAQALESLARTPVADAADEIDYVTLADAASLQPVAPQPTATPPVVLMVAARFGKTRLLDNAVLGAERWG
jgi:pantoate--beta-alanine ligase